MASTRVRWARSDPRQSQWDEFSEGGRARVVPFAEVAASLALTSESCRVEREVSKDVVQFEADALEPGRPQDVEEVVNYVAAMNHSLTRLKKLPLSLRLIREIHYKLLHNVRGSERSPGEFRKSQNWIGASGCTLQTATFVPPPPQELLTALGDLERFLHDEAPMPALIKVGLAHVQFETVHPFLDGSGRVGRLLITFLLCEKEILKRPLLYLSYYFKKNRLEYYDRLQAVRGHGDWEGWLKFFLRGVFEVSQEAAETARRIVNLCEQHRQALTQRLGRTTNAGLRLLESLYARPVVSVQRVTEVTSLAYANANKLVGRFEDLGLLTETTGRRRHRRFSYRPYLDLLADAETEQLVPASEVAETERAPSATRRAK